MVEHTGRRARGSGSGAWRWRRLRRRATQTAKMVGDVLCPAELGGALACSRGGRRPRPLGGDLTWWARARLFPWVRGWGGLIFALSLGERFVIAKWGLAVSANPTSLNQSETCILVEWTVQILRIWQTMSFYISLDESTVVREHHGGALKAQYKSQLF
jgi:hypothetical protein